MTFNPAENQGSILCANDIIKAFSDVDKYCVCSPAILRPSILSTPALTQAKPTLADGGKGTDKFAAMNLRSSGIK